MRFLFLYMQGFAVRAMLFRNIKKPFGKTSLISHAFPVFVCAGLRGSSNAFPQHKKAVRKDFSYQPCVFCFCMCKASWFEQCISAAQKSRSERLLLSVMRFLFLYVQGFAVRAMLFRNIKKSFGKTSLISHALSVFICARLRGPSNAFPQHKKVVWKDFSYQPCVFCFCMCKASRFEQCFYAT